MAQQIRRMNTAGIFLRSCVVAFWVLASTVVFGLGSILMRPFSIRAARSCARLWSLQLLFMCDVKVKVEGLEKIKKDQRYVFVANHQSYFDIPVMYAGLFANLSFVAKKELFVIPFLGWGMAAIGHIWIDRKNARKARKSITRAVSMLKRNKISLVLFPEGTRSMSGKVGEFKRASFVLALEAGVPVVPVAICGTREVQPKSSLKIIPGVVKLIIGDPLPIVPGADLDKGHLSGMVRETIVKLVEQNMAGIT
ncbi:MAG: lysophospholipid acyltransferase family protein [Chitinivibrionales bacterium]